MIRETLLKQIRDKELKRQQDKAIDDTYGQKLSVLASLMQKQDQDMIKKQKEMQFMQLTKNWDEMKRSKEELKTIERIFK